MHNDHLDPDLHDFQPEAPESHQTVLDFFSAENEADAISNCSKYNGGLWLEFTPTDIILGSIVEGCDFGTMTYILHYADNFTGADVQARINAIERDANAIWEWANRPCDKNGKWRSNGSTTQAELGFDAPDIDYEYRHFEQGERSS
jgi:hypothetical protein